MGKQLPFETVAVNPRTRATRARLLDVYIVSDASKVDVTPQGCAKGPAKKSEPLDSHSVMGGCFVAALEKLEIRCSSDAVKIFGTARNNRERSNPALLYVLSHELAHIYQRRAGEYSGRLEEINLSRDGKSKLQDLRDACDPVSTRKEEEADSIALAVMSKLLALPPYREPVFSERGSMYWNIDRLALASNAWQRAAIEREFSSQSKMHPSFEPNEFPTPPATITKNAQRFVCEVITRKNGTLHYPAKSTTHPPVDQRLRRITETLQPIAKELPTTGGQKDFQPVARLQQDLGPIFSHMYRETGVYMEAVHGEICTVVNSLVPQAACR